MAGADEVARRLDEAHRAAEVGAAVGDGDVGVRVLAELLRALAHVGGRLAGVADPLGFGEDDLAVGVCGEVAERADRLPALLAAVEDRRDGEADGRQDDRGAGQSAERLGADREGVTASHRLALEVAGGFGLDPLAPRGRLGPVLLVRLVSHSSSSEVAMVFFERRREGAGRLLQQPVDLGHRGGNRGGRHPQHRTHRPNRPEIAASTLGVETLIGLKPSGYVAK